jgi:hypothetical protein
MTPNLPPCIICLRACMSLTRQLLPPQWSTAAHISQLWPRPALSDAAWGQASGSRPEQKRNETTEARELFPTATSHHPTQLALAPTRRALGDLQQLSSLTLLAPHRVKPALPTNQVLLPRLPALRTLTITGPADAAKSSECLDLLMRWLHVPTHLKIDTGGWRAALDTHVSVPQTGSLGGGWLEAIIENQIHASFLLATPEGTRALTARLPDYERPLEVVVWYAMAPQELAGLAGASRAKSVSVRQEAREESAMVRGPPDGTRLVTVTDEHLLALAEAVRGRGLEELELGGCRALTDDALLEFVKAGGAALKKVALGDARVLTDIGMFALHRYCPDLHGLTLQGAPLVTEMGVVPVVGSAPAPMRMFEFRGTSVGFDALAGMVDKLGSLDIHQENDGDHIVVMDKEYGVPVDYEELVQG